MNYTMNEKTEGTLYICATPIGNLEDITLRVLRVLREVDLIAAEDTRRTLQLLNHYDIKTPLASYHEHNRSGRGPQLVSKLLLGTNVALVSDSGMPGISDPGWDLARLCREAGVDVTICPGASAGIAGLVLSGFDSRRYAFEGFLPREKRRRKEALAALAKERRTMVMYEAPHRLLDTLRELFENFGDREVAAVREITKKFEEARRGVLTELIEHYEESPPRGEFVLVIEGVQEIEREWPEDLAEHVGIYIQAGLDEKDAMKRAAKDRGISKSDVYSAYKIKK